jgi:hypothetical protein
MQIILKVSVKLEQRLILCMAATVTLHDVKRKTLAQNCGSRKICDITSLKGLCYQIIFLKAYKIKSVLSVNAQMVLKIYKLA